MMKKLRVIVVILLVASMTMLTGCWNYQDIDTFAIVSGLAIDKGTNGQRYHLTFEVADISNGSESPVKPIIIESDGKSVYQAVQNASSAISKKMYFSHCNLYVISKQIASEGVIPAINWLNRDAVMRLKANIAVANADTAKDILLTNPTSENLVSYEIANMLNNVDKSLSTSPQIWLYQASDLIDAEGTSLIMPAIKIDAQTTSEGEDISGGSGDTSGSNKSEESDSKSSSGENQSTIKIPKLDGTAIFKNDKLVGFLSGDDTEYLLFVKNELKGGNLFLNDDTSGKGVTINITQSKTDITPIVKNDNITMKIKVDLKGSLMDDESDESFNTEEKITKLQTIAENKIKERIQEVVHEVQNKYDSDVFGFGQKVYQKDYKNWQRVGTDWDNRFKSVNVEVEPTVNIVNTAVEKQKLKK